MQDWRIKMGSDLRRKKGTRKERRRVLIVAEGPKTEKDYFDKLARHLRATATEVKSTNAHNVIGLGRDPLKVVTEAIRLRDQAPTEDPYDSVWGVVDVDAHALLPKACEEARRSGVKLAITNPCFELWLVWHVQDLTAYVTAEQLERIVDREKWGRKEVPDKFPFSSHPLAVTRAKSAKGGCDLCEVGDNPSSTVHFLVSEMEANRPRPRQSSAVRRRNGGR